MQAHNKPPVSLTLFVAVVSSDFQGPRIKLAKVFFFLQNHGYVPSDFFFYGATLCLLRFSFLFYSRRNAGPKKALG